MKAPAFTPPGKGSTRGAAAEPAKALERERGSGAQQAARAQVAKAKTMHDMDRVKTDRDRVMLGC
jgi:hypothetical protein